jgi:hypothetical protein
VIIAITGEINQDAQLISENGETYDLIESEKASELFEMAGTRGLIRLSVKRLDRTSHVR